jgi:lysozyme
MVNEATLDLITSFEGFVDHWYPDPAHGWSVPTCCWGHTDAAGEPKYAATKSKRFTKAEGRAILARDLVKYENAIRNLVRVPLNDNQFGALVSWCYNVGPGNVAKSTLVKRLNAGQYDAVSTELAKWNRAGGKVLAGLTRRRKAEAALFQKPASGSKPVPATPPAPTTQSPPAAKPEPKRGIWAVILDILGKLLKGK